MKRTIARRARPLLLLMLSLCAAPGLAQVLSVESIQGKVTLERPEGSRSLARGDVLRSGDRLRTGKQANLRLNFARYGFVDLGADSELRIERIPHASFATDLRSVLRVDQGYMRMVWKHPQISTSWPIFVYVDQQRASLTSGEYFFEHRSGRQIACVAAGQMAVTDGQDGVARSLHPQACYRLYVGLPPQRILRESGDWVAIRGQFNIGELPEADRQLAAAPRNTPAPSPRPQAPANDEPGPAAQPRPATAGRTTPARPVINQTSTNPVAPEGGPWALSVASFQDSNAAESQSRRLRDGGFAAQVVPVTVKGKPWYRVMIPGFGSAGAARQQAARIESELGMKGAWVFRFDGN